MDKISIKKLNEVYIKVSCEPSVAMELSDHFTFEVPGAKFMPSYRNKVWDGKIRLYNVMTNTIYSGLLRYIEEFCKSRNYQVEYESDFSSSEFSLAEANEFVKSLNLKITPRDYQMEAFVHAVRERRTLLLSPTASGKSLNIYLLARYLNKKTLIVVPTTTLVHQLYSDFEDYGYDSSKNAHKIFAGQDKVTNNLITISTWQSIYKMPKEFFNQFEVVIGDEAHNFKAKSLTSIMDKMVNCKYRFGFTGTIDGSQTNKLVLEGIFGPVKKVISTAELIEKKHLSAFKIKAIVLTYPDDIRKQLSTAKYQDELDYIVRLEARNKFIKNLALSLKGVTLIMFQFVEKHGQILYDMINKSNGNNKVFYVHGGVDGETRDEIRRLIDKEKDCIIIASSGVFSTGINIPKIQNIIFASPSKSKIRNLQSIGRGLRKSSEKEIATLFDIADDLSWKSKKNYTLNHFVERVKIFNEEKFSYKIYKVSLNV